MCVEIAIENARSSMTNASCADKENDSKKLNNDVVLKALLAGFPCPSRWVHLLRVKKTPLG